jgi:hypothetical protein
MKSDNPDKLAPTPSHEFSRILDIQVQEMKVRTVEIQNRQKEIELTKHEIDVNARLSEKAIDAQLRSAEINSKAYVETSNSHRSLWIFAIMCITGFSVYALSSGNEKTIIELIKLAAIVIGSLLGGYSLGYQKGKKKDQP